MMVQEDAYLIAGGGLAGLTLAWFLAGAGKDVLVIESKSYPRPRVCGEYLSLESLPILEHMGIRMPESSPFVSRLQIFASGKLTPVSGFVPLGAIGVSRLFLDNAMYEACMQAGVRFLLNTRVISVFRKDEIFIVKTQHDTLRTRHFINATGKAPSLNNAAPKQAARYLAMKYHIQDGGDDASISLYQYPGGYCGTSLVEEGLRCVCYLVRQDMVEKHKNLEVVEAILTQANKPLGRFINPAVERIRPVVISNFYFGKSGVQDAIGDSRYLVPPLTGNGMSLAIRDGYRKAQEILGNGNRIVKTNPAAELIQKAAESPQFKRLHSLMGMKLLLNQIVESTFGAII